MPHLFFDKNFNRIADTLYDAGMGTENIALLLYSLLKIQRPRTCAAVGLGYSTLFILKALADNCQDYEKDWQILNGELNNDQRRQVLYEDFFKSRQCTPVLHGIDNFSEAGAHTHNLLPALNELGLQPWFQLHQCDYQRFDVGTELKGQPLDFVWLDCGHQLDYPELINKFWPHLNPDNGTMAIHYTYVDVNLQEEGESFKLLISGAVVNAIKRQQLTAGLNSRFELISLIEPHKYRQGSLTLLRRVDQTECCRDAELEDEFTSLYGVSSQTLLDMNKD